MKIGQTLPTIIRLHDACKNLNKHIFKSYYNVLMMYNYGCLIIELSLVYPPLGSQYYYLGNDMTLLMQFSQTLQLN
jgi:hypothetical protein